MQYPFVMFDWGDTVMKDNPRLQTPMYQWPTVEAVDGAEEVLRAIHAHRTIIMATGADHSDEIDIRRALDRVGLNDAFDYIFCFKNTGLQKPSEAFYRRILHGLNARASDVLMVGDSFENDILRANRVGIAGVWLNTRDAQNRQGDRYRTIHCLRDLLMILDETPQVVSGD